MVRQGTRRPKSVHSRGSGGMDRVHVRHPEFPVEPLTEAPTADMLPTLIDVPEGDCGCLGANTTTYILDDFTRTLVADTYSNSGDGGAWGAGDVHRGAQSMDGLTMVEGSFSYTDVSSAIVGTPVTSYTGTYSWPHTNRPDFSECTGLDFTFSGWRADEAWMDYVVPAHPTTLAGILYGPVTFIHNNVYGNTVGADAGADLVVATVEPSGLASGTTVAHLPNNVATTVFIPSSLIPVEGQTMYVGMIPSWTAEYGDVSCGFNWPFNTGVDNSAKATVSSWTDTLVWQSWDVAADAWGAGLDSDDTGAWWYGNLPWEVTASGGTYGINGDSLYLTVPAGGQETLFAKMVGSASYDDGTEEDSTSYGDPWNEDLGVSMKARFRITTAGDVSESGSRYLYFTWNNARDAFRATVHLGDGGNAEGLTVGDGEASTFLAKAITEGSWMWVRMDTRHPDYVRGKLWVEGGVKGSLEPAVWDIIVSREDDTANPISGDFFEIGMSAGNATGDAQTIEVDEVSFTGAGEHAEWVVDRLGQSSGADFLFHTSQSYRAGYLWLFVDGMHVETVESDREAGAFKVIQGVSPDENAIVLTRYLVEILT